MMAAGGGGAAAAGSGQLSVPPGFRFHPTDEELLHYYLRKKVSYEAIDLDVIREVDLNKLEPWDLKDKCRIGSGCQNEWYFFSHKDKKYPTGTRTNRATTAGFWKATGRDKAIHLSTSKRIGLRKTLVFYTGRAPHGQKTDWIMHEYRLDDDTAAAADVQEDGWVVCRVFKKKSHNRVFPSEIGEEEEYSRPMEPKQNHHHHHHHHHHNSVQAAAATAIYDFNNFDGSMHLPQLLSPESGVPNHPYISPLSLNSMQQDVECSHNLLRLTSSSSSTTGGGGGGGGGGGSNSTGCGLLLNNIQQHDHQRMNINISGGDWSFLDKLLQASHHSLQQDHHHHHHHLVVAAGTASSSAQKFPFHYHLGSETEILKFPK